MLDLLPYKCDNLLLMLKSIITYFTVFQEVFMPTLQVYNFCTYGFNQMLFEANLYIGDVYR